MTPVIQPVRAAIAAITALLILSGCAPDYTQKQEGEAPLMQLYEAMGEPYPLTEPVFIGCGTFPSEARPRPYFRRVGEEQWRGLGAGPGELLSFVKDPTDDEAIAGVFEWGLRYCKEN
jgi:hypothetical protein